MQLAKQNSCRQLYFTLPCYVEPLCGIPPPPPPPPPTHTHTHTHNFFYILTPPLSHQYTRAHISFIPIPTAGNVWMPLLKTCVSTTTSYWHNSGSSAVLIVFIQTENKKTLQRSFTLLLICERPIMRKTFPCHDVITNWTALQHSVYITKIQDSALECWLVFA